MASAAVDHLYRWQYLMDCYEVIMKGARAHQRKSLVRAKSRARRVAEMEILDEVSAQDIAKELGMTTQGFYNWKGLHKQQMFDAYERVSHKVDQERVGAILHLRHKMTKLAGKAVQVVGEVMDSSHDGIRLKAAQGTIEYLDPRKQAGEVGGVVLGAKTSDLIAAALAQEPERADIVGEVEVLPNG
jgi:hypothetical protein